MATLNDIAKIAGVNKSTVSKALRNSGDINRDTARRIREIAMQLNYPLSVRKNAKRQIAIICPEVTSHYYSSMATALFEALIAESYHPFILLTDFNREIENQYFGRLTEESPEGIVCITEELDISPIVQGAMAAAGVPVVVMGLNYQGSEHDVLSVDERVGVRAAIDHLIEHGHERIAYVGDRYGAQRLGYIKEAVAAHGLKLDAIYEATGDLRNEACGYQGMQALMDEQDPPTAVMAEYDAIALGVYRAASERGLSVPEDISLIGFDDADFCRYLPVSLTSINSNIEHMCRIATAILMKKVRDPKYRVIQTVAVKPELMIRESTGPARPR